jgi:rubrerythrin
MFTPQQYRAKAAEYAELVKTAGSADEEREFRKLEMSFLALASNTQWMADNHDKTLHPIGVDAVQQGFAVNQPENIRSDAVQEAAAIANWNDEGGAPQASGQQQAQRVFY